MAFIIIIITLIAMWFALNFTYGYAAIENDIYILGITIPKENWSDNDVHAVVKNYKKNKHKIDLLGFLTCFVSILLNNYMSFMIIYIIIWFSCLIHIYEKTLKKYALNLYDLKKANGWPLNDDEYWLKGEKNPNISSILVEKRVGIGGTLNIGKTGGRIIIGIVLAFVIGLSLFLMQYDFADIQVTKTSNTYKIAAADMSYSFDIDSIKSVTLIENSPSMSKIHGLNSTRLNLGEYNVKDYGRCSVYIYVKNPITVLITTDNGKVLVNGKTEEETLNIYDTFSARLQ